MLHLGDRDMGFYSDARCYGCGDRVRTNKNQPTKPVFSNFGGCGLRWAVQSNMYKPEPVKERTYAHPTIAMAVRWSVDGGLSLSSLVKYGADWKTDSTVG